MSLLLDALNRASEEKAAALALSAHVSVPVAPPPVLPHSTDWPALELVEPLLPPLSSVDEAIAAPVAVSEIELQPKVNTFIPPIEPLVSAAETVAMPDLPIKPNPLAPAQALETAQTILRAKESVTAPTPKPVTAISVKRPKPWVVWGMVLATVLTLGLIIASHFLASSQISNADIVPTVVAATTAVSMASPASAPVIVAAPVVIPSKIPDITAEKPNPLPSAALEPLHTPPVATASPKPANQMVFQSRSNTALALESAYSALTQGQWEQAIQGYTKALQINPQERDALLGLAYIAHQQGRVDDARAYYKQVLRQEPSHPVANSALQSLSQAQGRPDVNVQAYDVAQQHPDSATAQSALAQELVRQGRLADAQQAFERAYRLEPHTALYAFNLAVALDRLRRYELARGYYERALTLSTQMGGERVSGVSHTVLRTRLEQLQASLSAQESNDQ